MSAWVLADGGRAAAGFRGEARDCVTRAIAIAAQLPYRQVYDAINETAADERPRRRRRTGRTVRSDARTGVFRKTYEAYLLALGFMWTPTMRIGQGTMVHLRADELPAGRLVVSCSRHLVAVVDGVIHDTHDPSRDGTRCVYGYYRRPAPLLPPIAFTEAELRALLAPARLTADTDADLEPHERLTLEAAAEKINAALVAHRSRAA